MWSATGLFAIVLVVAAPDGFLVFAGGVPDFRAVPTAAFTALDLARESVDSAVIFFPFAASLYFTLYHLEHIRINDGFVVPFSRLIRLHPIMT